jgi:hypothetical protein
MDLQENLLPHTQICCRLFLLAAARSNTGQLAYCVMEVEVERLEVDLCGRIEDHIILEALVLLKSAWTRIFEQRHRVEGARLHLLNTGVIILDDFEDHLVQVGQPFACVVVAGVAHQGVVIPRHALSHHERAIHHPWVQIIG